MSETELKLPGSFRDPSGFVFQKSGQLCRRILPAGKKDFSFFLGSGLCRRLLDSGKMVPFTFSEGDENTLFLEELPFISYPYEWSFSQLKEAALLTLEIMEETLDCGMILKDASAFNVAFRAGKAVFMDHTSFTRYEENRPWCAYGQFVRHFLLPLLLMEKKDLQLLDLLKNDLNGIPLELGSKLLPCRSYLDVDILLHVHFHALFEKRFSRRKGEFAEPQMPLKRLKHLVGALQSYIRSMKFPRVRTLWGAYQGSCSYTPESLEAKKSLVEDFCRRGNFDTLCEPGSGGGEFTQIAARHASKVIAADSDPQAVEHLFQLSRKFTNIYGILLDLNNPTPALGVFNRERSSFFERFRGDGVLGLALIHHLRITGNWTLEQIAAFFEMTAPKALVEFVPRDDPQTQQLLRGREEYCPDWELGPLTETFLRFYKKCRHHFLPGSKRVLLELEK